MRIVYYTGGILGSGRLVFGISIGNALERASSKCSYSIIHSCSVPYIADNFNNIRIPLETDQELSQKNYRSSVLYRTLKKLKPEVLLVNHNWFSIYHIVKELTCAKIYLADYTYDNHFRIPLPSGELIFDGSCYDRVLAIEPFESAIPMERINPLIIRNRDEIFPGDEACRRLGISCEKPTALLSFGYQPDHYERLLNKYRYLEKDYYLYRMPYDIFPAVDYYNAFDLIVCAGGYNNVWEVNYFNKKAIHEPIPMNFSDQLKRIKISESFHFNVNGADQLVEIMMNM